ncbi:MAG: hypothetical protein IJM04_10460 [Prevotella sp.]|nr:hypothetical protein [Prevotella sp.]
MKKNLRILLLLLSCCMLTQAKAEDVVFVFADMGFSNGQKLNDVVLGDVKLTFDKAGGATDPAYYDGDKSARVYKANTLTFASTASDKKLTKVVMTFVSGNAPKSSINYGVDLSISGIQATWEGNLSSFTITNNTTGKDQLRFTKIEVTLSGGGVQPTVPEVTSLTALKALEPGTKAWLTLGRDNPGLIEYVYDANATEAYVRDNSTAIRFYDFLPDDAGWHTNTNGALIGSVLGEYKVVDGMPEFHHVSASIADSILCLDNWQDASARPIENLGDLADDTYRADLVEVKEVGITLSGGQYYLTHGSDQLSLSTRFIPDNDIPDNLKGRSFNITGILGTTNGGESQLYYTSMHEVVPELALDESLSTNSTTIGAYNGRNVNVTVSREMVTGTWNTLCLPFEIDEFSDIVSAAKLAALTGFDATTNTLEFTSVSSLEAGVPYLVFPEEDVDAITIQGTTIDSQLTPVSQGAWEFIGIYDPTTLYAGDTSVLFLGTGNTLYYPNVTNDLKAFRAYFRTSSDSSANICVDGISTGITTATLDGNDGDGRVYNVSGQFVGTQTRDLPKGVYLRNGNKIIVK